MMKAAAYEPEVWTVQDLPFDPLKLGFKGSPTSVSRIFPPPGRTGGETIDATIDPKRSCCQRGHKAFSAKYYYGSSLG